MTYRREIDGLRAIAVIAVILFHAGIVKFSGGFVGVDVFFVISGHLITALILTELSLGKFTFLDFYERRIRRILPPLFLVMFLCIPFAWFAFVLRDMKDFSQSLVAVTVFASNYLFWIESGYFDTAAELKPLIHTWSLAVEEQYYLIFPALLMLVRNFQKRFVLGGLGFIFLSSLALANWAAHTYQAAAFYLLPTRAWEFLIGSFTAFYLTKGDKKEFNKALGEAGGLLGLMLIFYAIFFYNKTTPFPGFYALVPTLGTALVILFCNHKTAVGKLLGNKVLVGVGLLSYSAYLWHQPLFVFARLHGFSHHDTLVFLMLSCISIFLAYLSWRFVEVPFRNRANMSTGFIFAFSIVGSVLFFSFGLYGHLKNGDIGHLSEDKKNFLIHFENELPAQRYSVRAGIPAHFRYDCDFHDYAKLWIGEPTSIPVGSISQTCFTRSSEKSKVVFVWGDSHAQHLYFGLSKALPKDYDLLQVASAGCIANAESEQSNTNYCDHSNWFAYNTIKDLHPDVVIIAQNLGHDLTNMEKLSEKLKKIGVRRVIFTGPTPHWVPGLPDVIAHMLPQVPERTFLGIDKGILDIDQYLKHASTISGNLEYQSLIDYFCNRDGCLVHYTPDVVASISSFDYGHLTPIASLHLAEDLLIPIIVNR